MQSFGIANMLSWAFFRPSRNKALAILNVVSLALDLVESDMIFITENLLLFPSKLSLTTFALKDLFFLIVIELLKSGRGTSSEISSCSLFLNRCKIFWRWANSNRTILWWTFIELEDSLAFIIKVTFLVTHLDDDTLRSFD